MTTVRDVRPALVIAPMPAAPQPLAERLLLSFQKYVSVEHEDGLSQVRTRLNTQKLRAPGPGMRAVLDCLAGGGATADELAALVHADDGSFATLYYRLKQWEKWRLLRYTLVIGGAAFLTVEPIGQAFAIEPGPVAEHARFALSRFALCRRSDGDLTLESPLSHARVVLAPQAGALLGGLVQPRSAGELATQLGMSVGDARDLLSLLASQGLLSAVGDDGVLAESADQTLQQWNFHDLLFHARSRTGRQDYAFGATFRFLGAIEPQPAVKPPMSPDVIALHKADIEQLKAGDQPFTRILEERCSVREYGDQPISLAQLGEFLYRVARVRAIVPRYSRPGMVYEASNRPYPGGGAGYELELYLTVNTCDGLAAGLYHYDPLNHQLERLSGRTAHLEQLLSDAWTSAAQLCTPQVLITYASRFQRMGWKYDAMAYAATLKNVGALYQTMYLVATAMNLAPCGLGSGNSDLLAQAAGLDYLKESSVGEFMLGSRRPA